MKMEYFFSPPLSSNKSFFQIITLIITFGLSVTAYAGLFGFGGTSWKEEVLLHDGSKIIVERSVSRGGRHEIGQQPPFREQSIHFIMPGTTHEIVWEDHFSEDVGSANFLAMALGIFEGAPYIVAYPMGCLSYNKWGRPNPPYVIFKYQDKEWKRIPLQELPVEINTPNLIFSSPDNEVEKIGKRFISAEIIQKITARYRQPEYRTILREALPGVGAGCEELIQYKGYWIMPNDPVARKIVDRKSK